MTSGHSHRIRIEVVYATPACQTLLRFEVAAGTTVGQAIEHSGIGTTHPEIDFVNARAGIFGKPASLEAVLEEGDRVEIYRPLQTDPKDARRQRVGDKGRRPKR